MKDKNATAGESWVQALKFLAFSLSAGVIQIVSDTIMLELLNFVPWVSYLIALVLSVL